MIDKIRCEKRIGNDIHKELIAMFKEIQNGWEIPLHISEDEYNSVRENKSHYSDAYVGLVGFNATFGLNILVVTQEDLRQIKLHQETFLMKH